MTIVATTATRFLRHGPHALSAAVLAGFAISSLAQTVSPGIWHDDTEYTLNGKPLPQGTDPMPDQCLSDADAKNLRKTMAARLQRDNVRCTITNWDYAGTTLKVALSCANEQGRGNGTVTGAVTPTSYDLKGQLHGQHAQAGAYTLAWTWRGKRVGDCK
ncbi:hypothetical protein P350_21345 [Burkholderia cepacia JBK9]|uniref:Lipoprotein n=1 Tax=Burkholderia arboris TaxID=488730 RepID=A0A9Q9SIP4_9BURK|nr:DUF3617 family protein [Burkholderia arboris]ALX14128.1 hypothetical protein P350_21345 [Burkholderia cepacia JBK9]MCA8495021.1 DUF3617 domain-containing protein [Burkholderia arboris]VWB67555.1 hypothetical protein BAR24066_03150 [Burkholderia arboris]